MAIRPDLRRGEVQDAVLVERQRAGNRAALVVLLEGLGGVVRGPCAGG
jgi:hypothetical protein